MIELECQSCSEVNKIDTNRKIPCQKCAKPITGRRYKVGALAVMPFLFGAAGFSFVDRQFIEEERYPFKYEYALVDGCINSYPSALNKQNYAEKQDICLCAVELTIGDISFSDFTDDHKSFSKQLVRNIPACR